MSQAYFKQIQKENQLREYVHGMRIEERDYYKNDYLEHKDNIHNYRLIMGEDKAWCSLEEFGFVKQFQNKAPEMPAELKKTPQEIEKLGRTQKKAYNAKLKTWNEQKARFERRHGADFEAGEQQRNRHFMKSMRSRRWLEDKALNRGFSYDEKLEKLQDMSSNMVEYIDKAETNVSHIPMTYKTFQNKKVVTKKVDSVGAKEALEICTGPEMLRMNKRLRGENAKPDKDEAALSNVQSIMDNTMKFSGLPAPMTAGLRVSVSDCFKLVSNLRRSHEAAIMGKTSIIQESLTETLTNAERKQKTEGLGCDAVTEAGYISASLKETKFDPKNPIELVCDLPKGAKAIAYRDEGSEDPDRLLINRNSKLKATKVERLPGDHWRIYCDVIQEEEKKNPYGY